MTPRRSEDRSAGRIRGTVALALAAAFGVFGAIDIASQDRPPAAGMQYTVNVGLKLVQVFVTDSSGRPVTGLKAGDFTLFDNGVPQPLAAFEVHSRKIPAAVAPAPAAETAPVDTPRVFIFLFDYFMNDPQGIFRSKAVALEFIDKKARPEDRIGILSYSDYEGFNILLDPTTDHPRVRKTIVEMKGVPRLKSSSDVYFFHGLSSFVDKLQVYDEVSLYIQALGDLAEALREIEGFKNVLFFSRGLSTDFFLDDPDYGLSLFDKYQAMLDALAQSESPIFAVNTLGIRGPSGVSAWRLRGVDALTGLSKATGGTYFATGDYPKRLSGTIDESTANYYVLGYRLDADWHGRFHELKVVVKRPGCEIRMPRGYFSPKSFSDFTLGEKHGQLLDLAQGKESGFLVPYEIPMSVFPIAPAEAGRDADCLILCDLARPELRDLAGSSSEIALFVFDEKGEMSSVRMADFSFAEWRGESLCPYFAETLPPGRFSAGIVIRNVETGIAAVGRTSFVIPGPRILAAESAEKPRLELDPPLLLRPGTETDFFKLSGTPGKTRQFSVKDVYPFVSVSTAPVLGVLDAEPAPLQAVVRLIIRPRTPDPDISWSAVFVRSPAGAEIPLEPEEIASQEAEGATAFLLGFDRPRLRPGEYLLRLTAVENSSGRKAEVEIPLRVR